MHNPFRTHKDFWTPARKRSMWFGVFLLALAIAVQIVLGHYASYKAANGQSVSDLFLDNLPVVNLDFIIVSGVILFWAVGWWLLAITPKRLIFGTKAIAFFIACKAFFGSLTHIALYPLNAPPGPVNAGWGLYKLLNFPGELFFSGHTGFPFLLALIFWDEVPWRYIFLALTVFFGAVMLLTHEHYSIDVFAAPFIVYGTYRIAEILFPKDAAIMEEPHGAGV
jgi:hypothetical protein